MLELDHRYHILSTQRLHYLVTDLMIITCLSFSHLNWFLLTMINGFISLLSVSVFFLFVLM